MPKLKGNGFANFITTIDNSIQEIIAAKDNKNNNDALNTMFAKMLAELNEMKVSLGQPDDVQGTPVSRNKADIQDDISRIETQFVKSILAKRVPQYMPPINVFYSVGPVREATVLQFLIDISALNEATVTTLLNSVSPDNLWKLFTARGIQHAVAPTITRIVPNATSNDSFKTDMAYVYPLHQLLSRFPNKAAEIFVTLKERAVEAMLLDSQTSFSLNGDAAAIGYRRAMDWLTTYEKDRLPEILNVIPVSKEFVTFASSARGRVTSAPVWSALAPQARLLFSLELEATANIASAQKVHSFYFLVKQPEFAKQDEATVAIFKALMQNYSSPEHVKLITAALCDATWKTTGKINLLRQFLLKTSKSEVALVKDLGMLLFNLLGENGKLDATPVPDVEKQSDGTNEMVNYLLTYADEKDTTKALNALIKVLEVRWNRKAKSYETEKTKATNMLYWKAYDMLLSFIAENDITADLTPLRGYKMLHARQQEGANPWELLHEKVALTLAVLAKESNSAKTKEFTTWFGKLVSAKKDDNKIALTELLGTAGNNIPKTSMYESRLNVFSGSKQASRQELVDLANTCVSTKGSEFGNYERWLVIDAWDEQVAGLSRESKQLRTDVSAKLTADEKAKEAAREARMAALAASASGDGASSSVTSLSMSK